MKYGGFMGVELITSGFNYGAYLNSTVKYVDLTMKYGDWSVDYLEILSIKFV